MYLYILLLFVCIAVLDVKTVYVFFFFQAEDGIRDLVRSRGLGDVYKRQVMSFVIQAISSALQQKGAVHRHRSEV